MSSSGFERVRFLVEPALGLAMLAPLVPLVERWSGDGPRNALLAGLLGSVLGLLLARRGPRLLAAALVGVLVLLWAELGHLWPPLALLRADVAALLAGGWPGGAAWQWVGQATARWLAAIQSERGVLMALAWHCCLAAVAAGTLWRLWHDPEASAWPLLVVPLAWLSADGFQDDRRVAGLLWALAAGASLAVVRQAFAQERRWERAGFAYSDQISYEVLTVGVIAVATMVSLAWLSPGLMDLELARPVYAVLNVPWQAANRLSGGRLEALARRSAPPVASISTAPPAHRLSGARVVSEELLFQVTLPDEPRPHSLRWRTWTLERYDGHGWSSGQPRTQRSSGRWSTGGNTPRRPPPGLRQIVQAAPGRSLVGSGLPAAAGLIWTDGAGVTYLDENGTLVGLRAARNRFTAVSVPASLQGRDGPVSRLPHARVSTEATALPAKTPLRVRLLARLLAGSDPRPEAMAAALERALRRLPYETDIPAPTPDQDAVDWFLFEQGRGYCDYFASAFVVMARAVGLPARLVLGYAPGTFDPATRTYLLTGQEAHAWAEVWIDGRGWVEFDPTPADYTQLRVRPTPVVPARVGTVPPLPLAGLAVMALAAVAVVLLLWRVGWSWHPAEPADAIGAWAAIQERAARLGAPPSPAATPAEQAGALAAALQRCVVTLRFGRRRLVVHPPDISAPLTALAAAYARARYGPPAPAPALPGWRRLLRALWWLLFRPWARSD